MIRNNTFAVYLLFIVTTVSCSVTRQFNSQAVKTLLDDTAVRTGHTGISIYEPATKKYWYNYDADKYFVPASNTKLFTLYAGMKCLGDSLAGLKYFYSGPKGDQDRILVMMPTGDPGFLHPGFDKQPVLDLLRNDSATFESFCIYDTVWKEQNRGYGWAWDDYNEVYMTERCSFPIFGNVLNVELNDGSTRQKFYERIKKQNEFPPLGIHVFKTTPAFFDSLVNEDLGFGAALSFARSVKQWEGGQPAVMVKRDLDANHFSLQSSATPFSGQYIPLHFTAGNQLQVDFLKKKFRKSQYWVYKEQYETSGKVLTLACSDCQLRKIKLQPFKTIYTRPSDSLFIPMMHNSDNFFAEQTLLMASNQRLGYMNDTAIIDNLLSTDLKDIPQRPKWVDGSGLSRYNLFTPKDLVYILDKMSTEFGLKRMQTILPTGNAGTLRNYYVSDSGFIFAKTGSMSNHIALSGYLITKKNKLLVFSILNNHIVGRPATIRRAVERFLETIRENY